MDQSPGTAFVGARPVQAGRVRSRPLRLRPADLADPPCPAPRPGAWLESALAAETRVMTPAGPRAAGRLVPGDLVLTLDAGALPVLWTGRRAVASEDMVANPDLGAVLVAPGALGAGAPRRPLRLSPRAGVLVPTASAPRGALTHAVALCGRRGFAAAPAGDVTYVQLLLTRHGVIAAEGLALETLHPGRLGTDPAEAGLRSAVLAACRRIGAQIGPEAPEARPRARPLRRAAGRP